MRYILKNISFFITLIILASVLIFIFRTKRLSLEQKRSIRDDFIFCALLVALTFITDLFYLHRQIAANFMDFATVREFRWGLFVEITSYIYVSLALTGLLMSLRTMPVIGNFLMWLTWLILTLPFRLFYFAMNIFPNEQNLLDLMTVKLETTKESVFTALTPAVIVKALLPSIIIIIIMKFVARLLFNQHKRSFRIFSFTAGALLFAAYCMNPKGLPILVNSYGHSMKILNGTAKIIRYKSIPRDKAVGKNLHPKNNIVLILDESIRADYLSINNKGINTTPELERYINSYPDNIFNYGIMISTATISFPSRIAMLAGINHVPDKELRNYRNPTIFDIAKAFGYKTILINTQGDLPDIAFRDSDLARVDEVDLSRGDYDIDFKAADSVRQRLMNETGLFIFLEKIGSHVHYESRYPNDKSEHQVFMPKMSHGEFYSLEKRNKVINSYKNAIRYNIDGFFRHLFGENLGELKNCTIFYTSDHGQSLLEDGNIYFQGTGEFEQHLVPFLIFSSDEWVLKNLKRPEQLPSLHHMNIIPTVCAIISRDLNYYSGEYDSIITSRDKIKTPPLVIKANTDKDGRIILPVNKYMY